MTWLEVCANIAAILTAIVAGLAWGAYRYDLYRKRKRLEAYLKAEKEKGTDKGQRTMLHLMVRLGLTEAEVMQASFRSKHLIRRIAADPKNDRAEALLLEYTSERSN
jgi:hypothetical protein